MRRGDLVVGESYYHDRSTQWRWRGGGCRVVVLDTDPWTEGRDWRHEPRKTDRGNGVLVDMYYEDAPTRSVDRRCVVQLAHLRGPWEPTRAEVQRRVKERREAWRQESAAAAVDAEVRQGLVRRARQLGLVGVVEHGQALHVSPADLALLLDTYERSDGA